MPDPAPAEAEKDVVDEGQPPEREPHPHEPNIPPTADDPEECEACKLFGAQHDLIRDLTQQRDAWRDHKLSDKEAQAISACVKALDPLVERSGTYGSTDNLNIGRVLDYLHHRYGVTQEPRLQKLIDGLIHHLDETRQTEATQPYVQPAPFVIDPRQYQWSR